MNSKAVAVGKLAAQARAKARNPRAIRESAARREARRQGEVQ